MIIIVDDKVEIQKDLLMVTQLVSRREEILNQPSDSSIFALNYYSPLHSLELTGPWAYKDEYDTVFVLEEHKVHCQVQKWI